jgi:ubiquinone/menaquinone biosynthesis C-methylase UbiE
MRTRDATVTELLDADSFDDETLSDNLADIRRINALLGWTAFTSREVLRQLARRGARDATLLDVASGSADIPLAIARRAARLGVRLRLTCTDVSPQVVRIAAMHAAAYDNVCVERQDALSLPYPPGSFDLGLCTLALHHFDPDQAVTLLSELRRVSRRVLVFDAVRSMAAYYGAWLMTRLLGMHPMTRHDAPVSVLRAYTADELRQLALAAGLKQVRVRVTFPFRLVLSAEGEHEAA